MPKLVATVKVTLLTKRGKVNVEFFEDGTLLDVFVDKNTEENWDRQTWKKERSRLISRARKICNEIGTFYLKN